MARPKEFDPDVALAAARDAFWEHGYEPLSTADLCSTMNIARQSLYDTFGSKRELYLRALERYRAESFESAAALLAGPPDALSALDSFLRGVCDAPRRERSVGCMLLNAVGELGPGDAEVMSMARANQRRILELVAAVVRGGVAAGQLRADLDPAETATRIVATYYGIRSLTKIDPSLRGVDALVEPILASLRR
jgi:TetR/AcrR family transcriptional regulator, transcriptional repressor for nem operon